MRQFIGYIETDYSDETGCSYENKRFWTAPDDITMSGQDDILMYMCQDLCSQVADYFLEAYKHPDESTTLSNEEAYDLFV